jgi:hypothetical protein
VVIHFPSSAGILFRLASLMYRLGVESPLERCWQKGFVSPHVTFFDPANLKTLVEANSRLRLESGLPMVSVCAEGLYARVRTSAGLPAAIAITAALGAFVALAPYLPADFEALVFRLDADG